jgi:glycosyltransferase involved in cell wall biosynthesis
VLVDLHDTSRNPHSTGIQRVARETARRWSQHHDVILIGSTDDFKGYRRLSQREAQTALYGVPPTSSHADAGPLLVPWKCVHLVPELPAELEQAPRYQAFAAFSGSTTGLIGYDCIGLTAAETTADGMSMRFARFLAAAARVDRIATIAQASQLEYRGWRTMLAGAGQTGPDIECVPLPTEAETPTDTGLGDARALLGTGSLPLVLSVGSHEPRKNHLALLHAAEILWREGLLFSLVFVGGNSWNSAAFQARVDSLRQLNRPVQSILALPDGLLWAAYRLAYCTVFPSLHEGFGLPVAESLASGTPVITSSYGSMRDLADLGGALLVNPRNDQDLTDTLRRLLLDPALRDHLAAEAAALSLRSWDDYATETWDYLVHGISPANRDRGLSN